MSAQSIETIIIGGGQAGLAVSYSLKQHGREHLVLEKAGRPASAWSRRWDSFTLVTPNWTFVLPGAEYKGDDPDGFMPRDEVVATFDRYPTSHGLPVRYGVSVAAVTPLDGRPGYQVVTEEGVLEARNVVVATGMFQRPKLPAFAASLPASLLQLHSEQYRNPALLPPGAVLVVGSGQSGCQIAEELYQSGRRVFISIGSTGRGPRSYRGKDIFRWLLLTGYLDRTPDKLPSPKARFTANPHVSGARGGHDLNLHQFARDGVTLLGHLEGSSNGVLGFAPDHRDSLAKSDGFANMLMDAIDGLVARTGLDAPGERPPVLRDGYDAEVVSELDLARSGVTTLIWAAGYDFDFDLVKLPVTDEYGFPIQQRCVTAYPGLYFVGLPWLHTQKSGLLIGIREDAVYIAEHITAREIGKG